MLIMFICPSRTKTIFYRGLERPLNNPILLKTGQNKYGTEDLLKMSSEELYLLCALKRRLAINNEGANRFFYNLITATICPQHVCSGDQGTIMCKFRATHRSLITCNMSCTPWYVITATICPQHVCSGDQGTIMCKFRATHRSLITCNMSCTPWYEGTAQLLSFTEFKWRFYLEPLTDDGGEETGVPVGSL